MNNKLLAQMMTVFLRVSVKTVFTLASLGGGTLYALSVGTPASRAAGDMEIALAGCVRAGDDMNTVTMDQALRFLNKEALYSGYKNTFPDYFQLFAGKGPVDPNTGHKLIAVTSNQISEDRRATIGRYGIWWDGKNVFSEWESEERVKTLVESVGLTLVNRGVWKQPDTKGIGESWTKRVFEPTDSEKKAELEKLRAEDQHEQQYSLAKRTESEEEPPVRSSAPKGRQSWMDRFGLLTIIACILALILLWGRMLHFRQK